jgi:hypothetical protein
MSLISAGSILLDSTFNLYKGTVAQGSIGLKVVRFMVGRGFVSNSIEIADGQSSFKSHFRSFLFFNLSSLSSSAKHDIVVVACNLRIPQLKVIQW